MTRYLFALVVVCLVVVAGCSGFLGGSSGSEDVETVSPVPMPTTADTTPSPRSDHPPGLFANGTVDVDRLVAAHMSSLANRSYTWRFRYAVTHASGDVAENVTRRVTVGDERFLAEQTSPNSRPQSLFVGDVAYLRTGTEGEVAVERATESRGHRSYAFADEILERFLTGVTVDVSVVERDGQTYYRLHTGGDDIPPSLANRIRILGRDRPAHSRGQDVLSSLASRTRTLEPDRPARTGGRDSSSSLSKIDLETWNYSMTAYVTPDGFVRTVAVDYYQRGRGGSQHVTSRYDYSAVESTTVTEPDWVSRLTPTTGTTASATATPTSTPTPDPTATTLENATATG